MRGKCNCGKNATGEYLIKDKKSAHTILLCDDCKPRHLTDNIIKI